MNNLQHPEIMDIKAENEKINYSGFLSLDYIICNESLNPLFIVKYGLHLKIKDDWFLNSKEKTIIIFDNCREPFIFNRIKKNKRFYSPSLLQRSNPGELEKFQGRKTIKILDSIFLDATLFVQLRNSDPKNQLFRLVHNAGTMNIDIPIYDYQNSIRELK